MQMLNAGFDRAQNVRSVSDSSDAYDPSSDTVKLDPAYDEYPESGVSLRDRVASIAAHEHCHAYLIKHRHQLPKVVREAADACQIFPEAFGGRMFDEVFCDLAAINVIGKPAKTLFNVMRADGDSDDTSDVRRYMHHSYPVLKLALAANNRHDRNLVRRTAHAMRVACIEPEVQKFSGSQEEILSERLSKKLAEYLHLPNGDAPLVTMLPYKKLPRAVRTKMDQMRREVGEAPLHGFLAAHAACQNAIEAGLIKSFNIWSGGNRTLQFIQKWFQCSLLRINSCRSDIPSCSAWAKWRRSPRQGGSVEIWGTQLACKARSRSNQVQLADLCKSGFWRSAGYFALDRVLLRAFQTGWGVRNKRLSLMKL